jgi:hypothetical protein
LTRLRLRLRFFKVACQLLVAIGKAKEWEVAEEEMIKCRRRRAGGGASGGRAGGGDGGGGEGVRTSEMRFAIVGL